MVFLIWMGLLWRLSGDPLILIHAEAHWGRSPMGPWDMLRTFFSRPVSLSDDDHYALDLGFAVLFAVLAALSWRLKDTALALYATVIALPMVASGRLTSIPRYGLEIFPAFVVLALTTRRPVAMAAYLALALPALVALTALFAVGWWIA
jgi:hypothetical protein